MVWCVRIMARVMSRHGACVWYVLLLAYTSIAQAREAAGTDCVAMLEAGHVESAGSALTSTAPPGATNESGWGPLSSARRRVRTTGRCDAFCFCVARLLLDAADAASQGRPQQATTALLGDEADASDAGALALSALQLLTTRGSAPRRTGLQGEVCRRYRATGTCTSFPCAAPMPLSDGVRPLSLLHLHSTELCRRGAWIRGRAPMMARARRTTRRLSKPALCSCGLRLPQTACTPSCCTPSTCGCYVRPLKTHKKLIPWLRACTALDAHGKRPESGGTTCASRWGRATMRRLTPSGVVWLQT